MDLKPEAINCQAQIKKVDQLALEKQKKKIIYFFNFFYDRNFTKLSFTIQLSKCNGLLQLTF